MASSVSPERLFVALGQTAEPAMLVVAAGFAVQLFIRVLALWNVSVRRAAPWALAFTVAVLGVVYARMGSVTLDGLLVTLDGAVQQVSAALRQF